MPNAVTFNELAELPETQTDYRQYVINTGYSGNIIEYLQDTYWDNSGNNPYTIDPTREPNAGLYNNPNIRINYETSQDGIAPEHARDKWTWVGDWVQDDPVNASQLNVIPPERAAEIRMEQAIEAGEDLNDPDIQAEFELLRQIRDGELDVTGGGGIPMIGYTPISWQDATWKDAPDHEDIPYHLVDWEDLNTDDLIAAIGDTDELKAERLRGATEMVGARDAAVLAQREAIEQALQEAQNRVLFDRTRGGFVGDSFHSQGNMLKNTLGARQSTALMEAEQRLEGLRDLAGARLANEELDYGAGVQAGEVGRDRDSFNLQGRTSVNFANQNQKSGTDQFNSGQRNNIRLFNTSGFNDTNRFNVAGLNDTNRFNTSNRIQVDSINASNAGRNSSAAASANRARVDAAQDINNRKRDMVYDTPPAPASPTFTVMTPSGMPAQLPGQPSDYGNTLQNMGNGLFYWSMDSLFGGKDKDGGP